MSALQIIFKLFPIIFFSVLLNTKDALGSSEINTFVIDDQTKISFSIPEESFYYANVIDDSINIRELKNINFLPYSEFTGFKLNKNYIKKITIKNVKNNPETISVIAGPGHLKSKFILVSEKKIRSFTNNPGTNRNHLSSINPVTTNNETTTLRNFTFSIAPTESIDLYYNFQMPNGFLFDSRLIFYDTEKYQENRRFGLWLEGIIAGSLLVLIIFTYYSYYQIRDKTTLYFCFWLVTAVLVIICTIHHDGIRLLEFLFDPIKDNFIFADVSFATRLALFTMLIQAMMFVIFSRQFINLKKYHPIAFQFTNLYLFVYISNFLLFHSFHFFKKKNSKLRSRFDLDIT